MNIVDAIIIVLLILGFINGLRKGALRSLVELVGSILVLFFAWTLKGSLANIFISKLNVIGNNPAISAVIYQVIAFVILIILFSIIYRIILGVTKVIEKIFDATIVLGIVSKIIGGVIGFIETYLVMFFILYILSACNVAFVNESKVSDFVVNKTPVVTPLVNDTWQVIRQVYTNANIEENIKSLFESKIITEENYNKLKDAYEEMKGSSKNE